MSRRKTINKVFKFTWLAAALLGFIAGVISTYRAGFTRDSVVFFIITFVAVLMFTYRRNLEKLQD